MLIKIIIFVIIIRIIINLTILILKIIKSRKVNKQIIFILRFKFKSLLIKILLIKKVIQF